MGLKVLETTLNLQGALSGAADVTTEGFIKKFARGGFADNTNAIANSALTVPLSYVPNAKNSSLFIKSLDSLKDAEPSHQDTKQPEVNNKYAINSDNPEPLAIFSFSKDDVPALQAAAYQAYFEDKCSLEFSKRMIEKARQLNEKAFSSIEKSIDQETKIAEQQLDSVEKYVKACLELDKNMNDRNQQMISSFSNTVYAFLKPDKLGLDGRISLSPTSLLNYVGGSAETITLKSNTALMTQMMSLAAKQMTNGASSLVLGSNAAYPNRLKSENQNTDNFIDSIYESDKLINLKSLSLSTAPNQSYIYGVSEDSSYISKLKLENLKAGTNLQKAAYLMTLLSNEMAISAGLGRLNGTQLGASFSSNLDYRRNFWGADEQVTNATTEATTANSLVDYFVVNEEGSNRLTTQKGVLLFDGTRQKSNQLRKNSFDAFVNGSIRSPLSKDENKVSQFSSAQDSAISRFEIGKNFLNTLHCRDKDVNLMTPRGLFARLISDFSESLLTLQNQEKASGQQTLEMCLLAIIGKVAKGDMGVNSPANVIKRSLLSVMAKKSLQLQYVLDSASATVSSNESQKPKTISTSTKVTTTEGEGEKATKKTSTIQTETTDASQTAKSSTSLPFTPNPNPKNPRLCRDEKLLFDARSNDGISSQLIFAFKDLPASGLKYVIDFQQSKTINFSIQSLYDNLNKKQNGLIDKLVKIYIDLCEEAVKVCDEDSANSSVINANRLTRNSQLDGTIMLSLILEAACFLSSEFVDAKLSNFSDFEDLKSTAISGGWQIDDKELYGSNMSMRVKVGDSIISVLAARAMSSLSKAVISNDISSAFLSQNGNLIVPEMESLSQNTIVSYDDQTTVSSIKDTFFDLIIEREIPALCFASTMGMIQYCESISAKYRDFAQQLLGIKKQTDEISSLVTFAQSNIGKNFFASLNDFSIYSARKRISFFKSEILSPSGRSSKLSLGELRCISFLLQLYSSTSTTNNFVVTALPKDFVTKSLNRSFSVSLDRDDSTKDARMSILIDRSSIFSNNQQSFSTVTLVRNPFDHRSFSYFDSKSPSGIGDIISNVILDSSKTGDQFLQEKLDTASATQTLFNEIVSHLFKKLFSTLSAVDLFSENIVDADIFAVDSNSANTARIFADVYGLSSSIFGEVFVKNSAGVSYISEDKLTSLTKLDFDMAASSVNVTLPALKFGEAELFYDLFETVYFQAGVVSRRIFTPSVLDETKGVIVNSSNFTSDNSTQQTTMNGFIEKNGIQQRLNNQASLNSIPQFDTYSVTINPTSDIVNK